MDTIHVFKVALKYQKGQWCRIEIKSDQSLRDLDEIIRKAFNYNPWDHLSMFFSGRVWKSEDFGIIEPDGQDSGAKKQIDQLGLLEGKNMEYVYDFGDDIQHVVTLEKIKESEIRYQTPCIIAKNKPRFRYCKSCKSEGKKVKAKWECIECLENTGKLIYLCEECYMSNHENHYAKEIMC
ncbi:MAG: hypothetical protein CEE42_13065 [Promethearchaeota archaeon Loki_b31]|nr:MAG: hypothetical protein CEE42_13065 [Candidatus Lokiarchaeota archaeon Loki_b31]